jgi:cell division protein FtsB
MKIGIATIFGVINLIFFSFLLIFYVFQVGTLTQKIYLKADYEKKLEKLSKENKVLEIEFSKLNSLANIENYLTGKNFVKAKPNEVKYIQILEGSVVTSK